MAHAERPGHALFGFGLMLHRLRDRPEPLTVSGEDEQRRGIEGGSLQPERASRGHMHGFARQIDRADEGAVDLAGGQRARREAEGVHAGELLRRDGHAERSGIQRPVEAVGGHIRHRADDARGGQGGCDAVEVIRAAARESPSEPEARDLRVCSHAHVDADPLRIEALER